MAKTSLDKSKIKILLLEGIHRTAAGAFRAGGYTNIEIHPKSLPFPELVKAVRDTFFIGIRSATHLSAEVFENAPKLTAAGCFCIGTNQVDLDAAQDRGIPVFNAPFSNTRSVAELVVAETVMLMRGIPARNASAHRGGWIKSASGSREVRGKTLGIVGYGHIGRVLGLARGLRRLPEQLVQLGVLLQVGGLEIVGPQHPEVVLHQLGPLLFDE